MKVKKKLNFKPEFSLFSSVASYCQNSLFRKKLTKTKTFKRTCNIDKISHNLMMCNITQQHG